MNALSVEVFRAPDARWRAFESALASQGGRMTVTARTEWAGAATSTVWMIGVRDGETPVDGLGVEISTSRAVPFYQIWRVERIGGPGPFDAKVAACQELVRLARSHRVLRLSVEIVDRDHERRRALGEALARLGLYPSEEPRNYTATSVVGLSQSEDELLAAMRPTARRHIRATTRRGYRVKRLEGPEWQRPIATVEEETWRRTGGNLPPTDWGAILRASREAPDGSAIFGLFNPAVDDERLLAFGWGCMHGDHAHYAAGGSIRLPGSSPPLTYALIWELMQWAVANGAEWFDLGGVPKRPGDDPTGRRLQDIARFKRNFGGVEQEVAQEWILTPRPALARAASTVSALAKRFLP